MVGIPFLLKIFYLFQFSCRFLDWSASWKIKIDFLCGRTRANCQSSQINIPKRSNSNSLVICVAVRWLSNDVSLGSTRNSVSWSSRPKGQRIRADYAWKVCTNLIVKEILELTSIVQREAYKTVYNLTMSTSNSLLKNFIFQALAKGGEYVYAKL